MDLLHGLPGMVYLFDNKPGYPFNFASKGCIKLTGYTQEELTGNKNKNKILDIIHQDDVQEFETLSGRTLSVGQPLESIFRIITKDGSEKSIWSYNRVTDTDDNGMPYLFSGYWIEISRLLRILNSQQVNRSTFDFLAKVNRNIRTPLNAVMGMAELGLREDMPYKVREYTSTVKQAGEGLISVLNDILDYTSIESGEVEINNEEYSLSSLLNELEEVAKGWIEAFSPIHPLKFNLIVGDNVPDLLIGDEARLRQIMLHILSNAIKFTDQGFISLSVKSTEDPESKGQESKEQESKDKITLTIIVEDTGRGIREEDLENIFKEFVQIDTKNIEGTGLGLAITRNFVQLMGGEIQISSISQVGSVFEVTIPQEVKSFKKICLAGLRRRTDTDSETGYTGGLRDLLSPIEVIGFTAPEATALIVDDIELNLRIAAGLLQPYKMKLDLCKSGLDAIEAIKNKEYDLIFMDQIMPVMDGIETVFQIRKLGYEEIEEVAAKTNCKEVPIIALTANTERAAREMFLENGFDDFLPKPVDVSQLNAVLEKWIPEQKRILKESTHGSMDPNIIGQNSQDSQNSQNSQNQKITALKIPGINTAKGIAMAGGAIENYLSILKEYHIYGLRLLREFKECLDKNDLESFRIHAHSLKSASGSIGADRLFIASEAFESAAKDGDIAFIQDSTPKFFGELAMILQSIHPYIKELPETELEHSITGTDRPNVLIIDDSPYVLSILKDILKDDYNLLIAKDGGKGLSVAKGEHPDLILLDLTMPDISGYDVLKALKSHEATKNIPVILISGNDSYESQIEGYALGAVEYIKKPFVRNIVKHRIDFNIKYIMLERGYF